MPVMICSLAASPGPSSRSRTRQPHESRMYARTPKRRGKNVRFCSRCSRTCSLGMTGCSTCPVLPHHLVQRLDLAQSRVLQAL
jgi:hypothetical protein